MNNNHIPPGFLEVSLLWVKTNAPSIYGSLASFGMALMVTLYDGKSWRNAFLSGLICLLISMGVINSLEYFGWQADHALLVGIVIGGIGVERCLSIMNVMASMKTRVPEDSGTKAGSENENK
ncbi:phage holin family protein [Pantoea agglomerans]|uniref:phage holin family protein n=1 Tax=Enterobacter agglomerans TaxID=549 RepID=UPI0017860EFE|nr:phage holin family protein [Pantoea agglomerans]MBD8159214.1 phage holin family protein [Pantoea agglomerans]MBD8230296.1 phage holin family protein [Pantoea agglomerans]